MAASSLRSRWVCAKEAILAARRGEFVHPQGRRRRAARPHAQGRAGGHRHTCTRTRSVPTGANVIDMAQQAAKPVADDHRGVAVPHREVAGQRHVDCQPGGPRRDGRAEF
jgi:hypothetical protein